MPASVLVPVVFRSTDHGIEVLMRQSGDGPVHFPTFVPDADQEPVPAATQAMGPLVKLFRPGKAERLGLLPIGDPDVWEVVLIPLTAQSSATLATGEGMVWQSMGADSSGWPGPSRSLHEVLRGCASDLERLSRIER